MTARSVLFLSTWQTECGIASFTASLRDALEDLGVECAVRPIDRRAISYLTRRELADYFREATAAGADFDIVHLQHEFGFYGGAYGYRASISMFALALAQLRGRSRGVVTFHTHPAVPTWRDLSWQKTVQRYAARVPWRTQVVREFNRGTATAVAPSRGLRRTLLDSGIEPGRVVYIPQGAPRFDRHGDIDRAAAKAALGYEPDDRVVLLFGFVTEHKGHRLALDAVTVLPEQYKLAIVGGPNPEGSDRTYDKLLQRLFSKRRLRERVRLTGYLPHDQVAAYFAAADFCILPYIPRGPATSAAAAWALASGRPVIGSRVAALAEIEDDGQCIRLVTPNAPRELAAAILEVDGDEEAAKTLVANAEAYCARTGWPEVARQYVELYERELARRP